MATSRVFYSWWVTLAFATMVFLSTGIASLSPFLYGALQLTIDERPRTVPALHPVAGGR